MPKRYLRTFSIQDTNEPDPIQGQVTDPEDLYVLMKGLQDETVQKIIVVLLDEENHSLGNSIVSMGTTPTRINFRRLLAPAIVFNASRFIILTNHPEGDATPTDEDRQLIHDVHDDAKRIATLCDYVIVGNGSYWAMSIDDFGKSTWGL